MIKRFNDFIINERFNQELNGDIERYIFYTNDLDENEIKKIYKILFNNGYKLGDANDVKDLNEDRLHSSFIIIDIESKGILYSKNPDIQNNVYSISSYLSRMGLNDNEYYLIKDKNEFDRIFNVLSINTYFNPRNVYESLLDKLEGPTDEEIINKLKDSPKKLFTKSVYMGFLLGVETAIKTGEITQNEKNIALIDSSSYGHYDIVELLLKNDADPSYLDNRAFMLAGSNGHKDVTKLLIKYKNKGLKESLLDKLKGPTIEEIEKNLLDGKIKIQQYYNFYKNNFLGKPDEKILKKYYTIQFSKGFLTLNKYNKTLKLNNLEIPTKQELEKYLLDDEIDITEYYNTLKILNLDPPTEQENNKYYELLTKKYKDGEISLEDYCYYCIKNGLKIPPKEKEEIKKQFLAGDFNLDTYLHICKKYGFDTYPTLDEIKKACLENPGDQYTLRKHIMRFKFNVTKEEKYLYYKKNFFAGNIDYSYFINSLIVNEFIDDETKTKAYSYYKEHPNSNYRNNYKNY